MHWKYAWKLAKINFSLKIVETWDFRRFFGWICKEMMILIYIASLKHISCQIFKGCGMGPWLVLVSPCFRENVVATCKIGSFLYSLDNILQKNVIVSFLEIKFQHGAHLKKGLFLTYFSYFLVTREKLQKFLQHISHSHTYTYFAHPIDFFCLTNFEKNTNLSGTVSLWYESWCWFLFAPFWNNQ